VLTNRLVIVVAFGVSDRLLPVIDKLDLQAVVNSAQLKLLLLLAASTLIDPPDCDDLKF